MIKQDYEALKYRYGKDKLRIFYALLSDYSIKEIREVLF